MQVTRQRKLAKPFASLAAFAMLASLGVVASGCGRGGALKEAASIDMNCPKNRVRVVGAGKTRDVEACGQRAVYHYEDGDWRMISRSGPAQATQPVPQPVSPTNRQGPAPIVAPAQPAPTTTVTGTPSMPPSSPPPPAPGQKAL